MTNTTPSLLTTITVNAGDEYVTADFGLNTPVGSLGDYVWYDVDGDGIQDAGEVGVAGVTIVVTNAAGDTVAVTTTDASGHYLVTELPEGS